MKPTTDALDECKQLVQKILRSEDATFVAPQAERLQNLLKQNPDLSAEYRNIPDENACFQHMILVMRKTETNPEDAARIHACLDRISPAWNTT